MHDLDASETLDDCPPSLCTYELTASSSSSASDSDLCPLEGQGVPEPFRVLAASRLQNLSSACKFLSLNTLRLELLEGTHGPAFSMGGSSSRSSRALS